MKTCPACWNGAFCECSNPDVPEQEFTEAELAFVTPDGVQHTHTVTTESVVECENCGLPPESHSWDPGGCENCECFGMVPDVKGRIQDPCLKDEQIVCNIRAVEARAWGEEP